MTFDRQGPQNTEATLKLAMEAAREEGIHKIVVASYSGETALKLAELEHEGIRLICVARARGKTGRPDGNLSGAMRQELEARGVTICTAAHALSGASGDFRPDWAGLARWRWLPMRCAFSDRA